MALESKTHPTMRTGGIGGKTLEEKTEASSGRMFEAIGSRPETIGNPLMDHGRNNVIFTIVSALNSSP
jgi:hypothetical protein